MLRLVAVLAVAASAASAQTADEIVEKILHLPEGTKVYVMAPVERRDGEQYDDLWNDLRGSGFTRVRVDGSSQSLDEPPKLSHRRKHRVEVVIDRAVGVVLEGEDEASIALAGQRLRALAEDEQVRARCRATARELFDVTVGAARYAQLYSRLLSGG